MNKIKLLPKKELIKTSSIDHADWNYKAVIRYIQLKRFQLCIKLMNNTKYTRLLEIGYGSGIFMPTLTSSASEIYGLDIHEKNKEVEGILFKNNIKANLSSASAIEMPFDNNFFDCIISISAIEFIKDLDTACKEINRVLKKDGNFIVITPGYSFFLDLGLKILTKQSANSDFEERRKQIYPTLLRYFKLIDKIAFPKFSNSTTRLYLGLKLGQF